MIPYWLVTLLIPLYVHSQLHYCEQPASEVCPVSRCTSPTDLCISTKEGKVCCNRDKVRVLVAPSGASGEDLSNANTFSTTACVPTSSNPCKAYSLYEAYMIKMQKFSKTLKLVEFFFSRFTDRSALKLDQ
ncbi:hypothetical protein RB195_016007 [Necator americanus]|uniref:WAP domain-containing protein n=1 Tax=Necator americanus TaxID=51031 RepID=A0ABR1E8A7_NECAM